MKKFIIKYVTKIDGMEINTYHESISVNENLSTNNVYIESLTTDIKLAREFFDREEADKIANLFSSKYNKPSIINH